MQYINPFDLLGITTQNFSDVNSYSIKKLKRQLIAEIELSDTNSIILYGVELTKGDCIKIIDELDNNDLKEFHFFIYGNLRLKKFLTIGDIGFFENFQTESIYNHPEFLDFISPFFSQQYDKAFLDNYKKADLNTLITLLSNKPIVNALYYEKCYKSTYSYIRDIDNEIKNIIREISSKRSSYINKQFIGLDKLIDEIINIELLNLLPSYFQNLRNQLAMSIRNLARDINNEPYLNYEPAFKIIEIAYKISIDALTKQTISKGYFTIKGNYEDEKKKQENIKRENTNNQIISKWTNVENQLELITNEIIKGSSKFISASFLSLDILILQIINPKELNNLTANFQGIRNRIANNICELAKVINNEPYHNYNVAFDVITIAKNIIVNEKIAEKIESTHQTIHKNLNKKINSLQQTSIPRFAEEFLKEQKTKEIIKEWGEKINLIEKITSEIKNGLSGFIRSNFLTLDTLIKQIINVSELNSLDKEFQNLRNQVARKIYNLSQLIYDEPYLNCQVAFNLISIAKNILTVGTINLIITGLYDSIEFDLKEEINKQIISSKNTTSTQQSFDKEKEEIIEEDKKKYTNSKNNKTFSNFKQYIFNKLNGRTTLSILISMFCGLLIWALLDKIIQIVALSILVVLLIYKIYLYFKQPIYQRKKKYFEFGFFSLLCVSSFLFHQAALIFIIYNILLWGYNLYLNLQPRLIKKNEDTTIAFLIIAFILSLIFNSIEIVNQTNQTRISKSVEVYNEQKTDSTLINNLKSKLLQTNDSAHYIYEIIKAINSTKPKAEQIDLGSEIDFKNNIATYTYDFLVSWLGELSFSKNEFYNNFEIKTKDKQETKFKSIPIYSYPIMKNGNIIGCSKISPEFDKSIDNKLIIKCGSNADVAVKMINYETENCIRYVYVNKNTTYSIRNIPEGRYYLKIAYGDSWGIKESESVCEGRFTSNTVFEKGKDVLDFNLKYDSEGGTQVPYYSLRLNIIYQDNDLKMNKFSTNNISENEFYNE